MPNLTERNPCEQPKAGDVLRRGKRTRTVLDCDYPFLSSRGPWVFYQTLTDEKHGWVSMIRPDFWRKWSMGAEVIKRA